MIPAIFSKYSAVGGHILQFTAQNRCSENSFSFLEITRHAFFDQSAWGLGDLMWHDNKQGWWKWFANGRRCSQSKVVTHSLYFIDDLKVLEFFWRRVCFVHYIYFLKTKDIIHSDKIPLISGQSLSVKRMITAGRHVSTKFFMTSWPLAKNEASWGLSLTSKTLSLFRAWPLLAFSPSEFSPWRADWIVQRMSRRIWITLIFQFVTKKSFLQKNYYWSVR